MCNISFDFWIEKKVQFGKDLSTTGEPSIWQKTQLKAQHWKEGLWGQPSQDVGKRCPNRLKLNDLTEVKGALNDLQNAFNDLVVKCENYSKFIEDDEPEPDSRTRG